MNKIQIKQFLQATSIKTDTDLEILYLGDWAGSGKKVPFQWSTPEKISETSLFCQEIYKNTLPILSKELNRVHKLKLSEKQYHIILGNWLDSFINQLFDKYTHIKYALNNYEILETSILNSDFIPAEYNEYIQLLTNSDEYNLQLYSQIFRELDLKISFKDAGSKLLEQKNIFQTVSNRNRKIFFKLLNLFSKNAKVTVTSPAFRYKNFQNYIKLFIKDPTYFRFDDFDYKIDTSVKPDLELRKKLDFGTGKSEFEKTLLKILPKNIPTLFLEGFLEFWEKTEYLKIQKTSIFYSANAIYSNSIYKFFLAQNFKELRIVTHQHGGNYGLLKYMSNEEYEKSVSDKFFTWGWSDKKSRYLPTPKLFPLKREQKRNILLALDFSPRYIYLFQTQHFSTNFAKYEESLFSLIRNFKSIVVRDYFSHNGRDTVERIKKNFPNTKIETPFDLPFDKSLQNTKIFISLHSSTTFLETLSQNIPTLVLLDPKIYTFREEFLPYLRSLLEVKIGFERVEDLIAHLEEISENPDFWWNSDEVQKAREKFIHQYARSSKNWTEDWVTEFDNILNSEK